MARKLKDGFRTYLQSCLTRQGNYDNTSCSSQQNLICVINGELAGYCYCQNEYYFDNTTMRCEPQKLNMGNCSVAVECRGELGLYCVYGKCICKSTHYWSSSLSSCCIYLFLKFQFTLYSKIIIRCKKLYWATMLSSPV